MTDTHADAFPPELLLESYPPAIRRLAERLRVIVRGAVPEAVERVRPGWRLIGYDVPVGSGRRTAYFAWVAPEPGHVHLGFVDGVLLADPNRVMSGRGITKRARWFTFRPGDRIDRKLVAPIIRESASHAGLSRWERLDLLEQRVSAGGPSR
jgi:hypothetical protein